MANRVVPSTSEVIRGAFVNIILKADQRTGRQVSGTVRDVLTRGDHHRGIKVRLTDGRIGRVQSVGSGSTTSSPSSNSAASASGIAPPTEEQVDLANNRHVSQPRGRRGRDRDRDMRLDEPLEEPSQQADLSAYIVPAKRRGKGKKGQGASVQQDGPARSEDVSESNELNSSVDVTSATATCPVCGAFEGDETAVAHHVAGHFE
ncbi:hypothetical protein F5Y05DRAFT_213234 [Hypoxylon sp. FL0543]|nr:hypothetical protein F5Y05DRAFT_213234 [Hypoxylon sp. FL0543]